MRCFEKVSLEEFKKYYDVELYDFNLPSRSTGKSAGYDFYAVDDCTIKRGESKMIISGVKANMENNDVLYLFIRSSLAIKYNLILVLVLLMLIITIIVIMKVILFLLLKILVIVILKLKKV